ncbi:uncharacterized protein LOC142776794 [Rhipicephalus microplus]|uniref:uncharacterized protein LOC142776794 n=1 Tax=Rhipicephalus microplus TaxID=6941 RepID=UPI003F6AD3BD
MAYGQRRRHRWSRPGFEDFDTSIQRGFRRAVRGGGDDFCEWQDLRYKLNYMRQQRMDLWRRESPDPRNTQPNSSKGNYDCDQRKPRGRQTSVAIQKKRACGINAERGSIRDEAATRATAHQTSVVIAASNDTAGNGWHSSMHGRPEPMHQGLALTNYNLTSTGAQIYSSSEQQKTPTASMAEKHFPPNIQGDFEHVERRNTEDEVILEQTNTENRRDNLVSETRNNSQVLHYERPTSPKAVGGPPAFVAVMQESTQDHQFLQGHVHPEQSFATIGPCINTEITGAKKPRIEEQGNVTSIKDRLQLRALTATSSNSEHPAHQDHQHRPPSRRRRREQVITSDSESDDSEPGAKVLKMLSTEGEGHRAEQSSAGRQELPSEVPSEDEWMMEDLMERFGDLYKQA